jgi:hypothetical protein
VKETNVCVSKLHTTCWNKTCAYSMLAEHTLRVEIKFCSWKSYTFTCLKQKQRLENALLRIRITSCNWDLTFACQKHTFKSQNHIILCQNKTFSYSEHTLRVHQNKTFPCLCHTLCITLCIKITPACLKYTQRCSVLK